MPEPPVAIIKSQAFIKAWEFSRVTSSKIWIRSSGAPKAPIALRIRLTVSVVVLAARGAAETMMAFLPLMASMKLPRGVTVGLVAGVIHAITPTGWATSMIPVFLFSPIIPTDFLSFR